MPHTMVKKKKNFSGPRLVWKRELPSPNAPPIPVPVCCNKIETTRRTESAICIHGNMLVIS